MTTCYRLRCDQAIGATHVREESLHKSSTLLHSLFSLLKGFSEEREDEKFSVTAHSSKKMWSGLLSNSTH